MKRFILAACVALAAVPAPAWAEDIVTLKSSVTVDGDVVRLGDLFDGASDKAAIVVAAAPQPGKRAVLDARWLGAVAANNKLSWQPTTEYDRTQIERASTLIPRQQVEVELLAALQLEGAPQGADIEIAGRDAQLFAPAGSTSGLAVRDLSYNSRTGRFVAVIEIPAGSPNATRSRVSGQVFTVTEVPVLSRAVNKGQVIGEGDIVWQRTREDLVRRDTITDASQLIGQTPRLYMRPGQPVRAQDIQRPVAVAKGALVTMILKSGAMTLTTQGKSIDEGAVGDVVRITNTHSNRTVEAKIEGLNLVTVTSANRIAAN